MHVGVPYQLRTENLQTMPVGLKLLFLLLTILFATSSICQGHPEVHPLSSLRHERATVKFEHSIQFSVYPDVLNTSGDWTKVYWNYVPNPSAGDWVGLFLVASNTSVIDPTHHAPTKYQYCYVAPYHMEYGIGFLHFRMVNMRGVYRAGFFRGGFDNPVLAAVSNAVTFKNPNEPLHGHLALTGNPTEMRLVWTTRDSSKPQVKWGTQSGEYQWTKQASSSTYTAKEMCDSPAKDYGWIDPGVIHQVTLTNLTPGMRYYYVFGDKYGWSEESSFKAAPMPGPSVTTRVLSIGDSGHGEYDDSRQVLKLEQPSLNTTKHLIQEISSSDLVIHVGDLSYADGYEAGWEEFFDQMKPVLAALPYMVCPGNHESDSKNSNAFYQGHDSGGECNVPYINRFAMPRPGPDQPWYGFDYGCIHFVMMSTEHNFTQGSIQYNFLVNHLKTVDRTNTPWLIFSGHRPMYIDSTNETEPSGELPVSKLLQTNIEPLLKDYNVDLSFWGHHHSYQRTCAVYQGKCTPGATVHIVIGMAGRTLMHNVKPTPPPWLVVLDDQHWGYSRFTANSSTLVFEYIWNDDGKVHDNVVLKKS